MLLMVSDADIAIDLTKEERLLQDAAGDELGNQTENLQLSGTSCEREGNLAYVKIFIYCVISK